MSRIGRMPIEIPAGVTVTYDNHHMNVKGPKGELSRDLHPDMIITVEGNTITVARPSEDKAHRALHGLTRALVANMATGVSEGFTKTLEINGVGYRAAKQGNKLALTLGFSHPVEMEAPDDITIYLLHQLYQLYDEQLRLHSGYLYLCKVLVFSIYGYQLLLRLQLLCLHQTQRFC